jgi:hypothetical protein
MKPFCDSTHKQVNFDGTETASREPHDKQAKRIDGPTMALDDAEPLCAFARFCDPHAGFWNLVEKDGPPQGHASGWSTRRVIARSGRLVARERATGEALEPAIRTLDWA